MAINLPEFVKEELSRWQDALSELPFRWIKPESLHITLCFIGDAEEQAINEIKELLAVVAMRHSAFEAELTGLRFGPNDHMPRMVWSVGPLPKELKSLADDVNDSLKDYCLRRNHRGFTLHITIGRAISNRVLTYTSSIRHSFEIRFPVEGFELMESNLLRDGAEYKIVESYKLKIQNAKFKITTQNSKHINKKK